MNICTPGNCICDAAEWPGDTDCFGDVVGAEPRVEQTWTKRYYYYNKTYKVVFSVDDPSDEEIAAREFYEDPDLTVRVTDEW